jgi:hypothetical protein
MISSFGRNGWSRSVSSTKGKKMNDDIALTKAFLDGKAAGYTEASELFAKRLRTQSPRPQPPNRPIPDGKQANCVYQFVRDNPGTPKERVVDVLSPNFPTEREGQKKRSAVYDTISRLTRNLFIDVDDKNRLYIKPV